MAPYPYHTSFSSSSSYQTTANPTSINRRVNSDGKSKPTVQCPQCDYTSNLPANMRWHMIAHNRETPYKCGKCNYQAVNVQTLSRHMNRHKQAQSMRRLRFKCNQCDYKAAESAYLEHHVRLKHGGQVQYPPDPSAPTVL